jgi:hypothetical protein
MRMLTVIALSLCLVSAGCDSAAVRPPENLILDDTPASAVSLAIDQRGFAPMKRESTVPASWDVETFRMRSRRTTWFRARQPMPNERDVYYCRFRLFEETFDSESDAQARLVRIRDVAPDEDVREEHISALRLGFRAGPEVYILATDAVMFEPEVTRLATDLVSAIPGAVAEARRSWALPN